MQITSQDKPSDEVLNTYLQDAEALVNMKCPSLHDETDANKQTVKKMLIKYAGAAMCLQNLDEGTVQNPNLRLEKAKSYWQRFEQLLSELSADDNLENVFLKVVDSAAYSSWYQPAWTGT
jgi:hypothetical protein